MKPKTILLAAPLLVLLALLQAYFWVPGYDNQTVAGPSRLSKFILGSIGDAQILNPILNADTASSRIVDLVFDGLLRLDENGHLEGRLAESWRISETAYLLIDDTAQFADGVSATGPELVRRLKAHISGSADETLKSSVVEIAIEPARELILGDLVPVKSGEKARTIAIERPSRIALRLSKVDPDLLSRLSPVLPNGYGENIDRAAWTEVEPKDTEQIRTALFARFPVLSHNPEITFKLRRDVRFHDGEPFDANDVVFTFNAIMDSKNLSPRTSDFEPIDRIEVIDSHTIKVVYKRLFSPAINAWLMGILPQHLLDPRARDTADDDAAVAGMRESPFNRAPVGTGAFRFVAWQSDELIHLKRNDDYWDSPPFYRSFHYRVIPDLLTQEVEFRSGAVDAFSPLPHQIARYRKDDRYRGISTVTPGYSYIGYNNRRPLFKDRRVPRALGMAIDVDQIIKHVLYDEGERVTGPYPIITRWYDPAIQPLPYDPAGALELLAEAGWSRNDDGWLEKGGKVLEFNLITNNGNTVRKAIMTIVQQAWRQIGVRVHTQVFEWTVFLSDFVDNGNFDAVILGWRLGFDPDQFQLWHSSQAGPKQLNFVGYNNPQADDLIERIRREYDPAEQERLAHQLHAVIAADQPYTFLMTGRAMSVLDRKIVMVDSDGKFSPVRAARNAEPLLFFLSRWRKLEHAPRF